MASARSLRVWTWLHTWSSLVCTLFMLLLCLTGLPLIFHHEIEHLTGDAVELPALQHGGPPATFDAVLQAARQRGDREVVLHAQRSAEGFYGRLGFQPRGEPFEEAGIPHIEMFTELRNG